MQIERVKKWVNSIKDILFCYKDGFFELPYLCNSPLAMVESLKRMPINKFDKQRQAVFTNNPFTKGSLRYQQVEDGLWIVALEIEFFVNVHTPAKFDDSPKEYYYLSYCIYHSEVTASIKDKVSLQSNLWTFYRPGHPIDVYHYKGASCLAIQFVFNQDWLEKNFPISDLLKNKSFKSFLDSDNGFTYWQDIVPGADSITKKIWQTLKEEDNPGLKKMSAKLLSLELIYGFFATFLKRNFHQKEIINDNPNLKEIQKAERILLDHLTKPFPGIELIAKKVNLSTTKLKVLFKNIYGKPIYNYFKEKQMDLAMVMLKNNDLQIKEIAYKLGYESPSKFTVAFKNHHKILPSQVLQSHGKALLDCA